MCRTFREPDCGVQFSSSVTLGYAIQHSAISAEGQMNAMPSLLKCCRWVVTRRTHSLVIVQHLWNPLGAKFLFAQAAGEDTANTCWRDYNFCSNCCAGMFKDRFHLFHVAFIFCQYWSSTVRGIVCLFLSIPNGIHPSVNSFL